MHRSATSMTARSLHKSNEVYMGNNLLLNGYDNIKGHYEQKPIIDLNDKILRLANGSWDDPPSREAILEVGNRVDIIEEIKSKIEEVKSHAIKNNFNSYGFKDPRLCLTIELFHPHLDSPIYVINFRNKEEISKSLVKRRYVIKTEEEGLKLSKIYNERLFNFMQKQFIYI